MNIVLGAAVVGLLGLASVRSGRMLGRLEAGAWIVATAAALWAISPILLGLCIVTSALGIGVIGWFGRAPLAARGGPPVAPQAGPPPDVLVVLPALNEAENLTLHLPAAPPTVLGQRVELLVVDDGSTDETSAVARSLGARVVRSPVNRGGGHALRAGFTAATELGASYVVTLDADGQHRFEDLPVVLGPLVRGEADLVVGSRRLGRSEGHSAIRSIGVDVFNTLLGALLGRRITDCASGYRALRVSMLPRLALAEDRHHTAELLLLAKRAGLRVVEVPIVIVPRSFGESRKGTTLRYACRFTRSMARSWWRATATRGAAPRAPAPTSLGVPPPPDGA